MNNEEVVFRKYSHIKQLENFATEYAESMSESIGCKVLITDMDFVIYCPLHF